MNILLVIWGFLKNVLLWFWAHKQAALWIVVILIIASLSKCNYEKTHKIEQLTTEKTGLEEKLKAKVTTGSGEVKIVYRDRDKIVTKIQYLPPEGYVTIETLNKTKDAQKSFLEKLREKITNGTLQDIRDFVLGTQINTGEDIVTVHDRGFCARPGFFIGYDGQYNGYPINAGFDLKFIFFQRWSAGIGTTINYPDVWISRHVDDITPYLHLQNVEMMVGYGKPYKEFDKSVFIIGARSNF